MLLSSPIFFLCWKASVHVSPTSLLSAVAAATLFQIPPRFDPDFGPVLHSNESPFVLAGTRGGSNPSVRRASLRSPTRTDASVSSSAHLGAGGETHCPLLAAGGHGGAGIDRPAIKQTIPWYSASSSIPRSVTGSDAQQ